MLDARTRRMIGVLTLVTITPMQVFAHGDVAPQAVNTDALPEVGEEWLTENPYRAEAAGDEVWSKAVQIGDSGFNQNCARCHGLGAVSGGLAPDLRYLEAEEYGDEWYIERFRHGMTQNGITKMPAFGTRSRLARHRIPAVSRSIRLAEHARTVFGRGGPICLGGDD